MNPYYELANAIIAKAVEDYRRALKGERVTHASPETTIKECEGFFRSDWYMILTKVSGELIIERVRREVNGSNTHTANN